MCLVPEGVLEPVRVRVRVRVVRLLVFWSSIFSLVSIKIRRVLLHQPDSTIDKIHKTE